MITLWFLMNARESTCCDRRQTLSAIDDWPVVASDRLEQQRLGSSREELLMTLKSSTFSHPIYGVSISTRIINTSE